MADLLACDGQASIPGRRQRTTLQPSTRLPMPGAAPLYLQASPPSWRTSLHSASTGVSRACCSIACRSTCKPILQPWYLLPTGPACKHIMAAVPVVSPCSSRNVHTSLEDLDGALYNVHAQTSTLRQYLTAHVQIDRRCPLSTAAAAAQAEFHERVFASPCTHAQAL